ncbi:MAG TPA: hypothetical protein VK509_06150 [Polyangiales bacterium]|nr:hypothetical protein [Polyangiales bacterium]
MALTWQRLGWGGFRYGLEGIGFGGYGYLALGFVGARTLGKSLARVAATEVSRSPLAFVAAALPWLLAIVLLPPPPAQTRGRGLARGGWITPASGPLPA